jgi:aminopeptidase N
MVEASYVGMEHQSAIAYGNGFQWGRIRSNNLTPWDSKSDRLVVHEMSHEWFGNNITTYDFTDRWVQEGFAGYAEELFIEEQYGKKPAEELFFSKAK